MNQENSLARRNGWVAISDPRRGDGWCRFSKSNKSVWLSSNLMWVRAEINNGFHEFHKYYATLEEALNG